MQLAQSRPGAVLRRLAPLPAVLTAALFCVQGNAAPLSVRVFYAGSLVGVFDGGIVPAFARDTGLGAEGRPGGSVALANLIRDRLEIPDVFISADPDVNRLLMSGSSPPVSWFFTLVRTTMVIAYSPRSTYAPAFREAAAGHRAWYQVLQLPGLRLGRTDPRLDPKGYRTLLLFRLAERYYHQPGLEEKILGPPENPRQIFPEEALVGRMETGQLDAGVFYLTETVAHRLPAIRLPDEINLGNPAMAAAYARVTYTAPTGEIRRGSPILYTITILARSRNLAGAIRFVQFLYGPAARRLFETNGLLASPVLVGGEARAVPPALRPLINRIYGG